MGVKYLQLLVKVLTDFCDLSQVFDGVKYLLGPNCYAYILTYKGEYYSHFRRSLSTDFTKHHIYRLILKVDEGELTSAKSILWLLLGN